MITINENEFFELLASTNQSEHSDLIIDFKNVTNVDLSKITFVNKFLNCKFQGKRLDFINLNFLDSLDLTHRFHFENCEFLNDVYFKDCFLQELRFTKISKSIKNLNITPKKIGFLTFDCQKSLDEEIINETNITIHDSEIIHFLDILNLKSTGNLLLTNCKINRAKIHNCSFKRTVIDHSNFSKLFQFTLNQIEDSYFAHNEFDKTDFSNTDFGIDAAFNFNDFSGTALFSKIKNPDKTQLKIESCNFMKYTYFNNTKLYSLHIDTSKFQEFTSFQELELNTIFIDRTIFEKSAFFDDITISRFNKCNKRTLRNIKQQLLRTDNKIDYDNFRSHELNSYKEEIKQRLKNNKNINRKKLKRDLMILRVNSFFSENGTDWFRALKRTILVAVLFYSLFYIIYNFNKEFDLLNSESYNRFFIGFFRYLLLTDFHNPLIDGREYLTKSLEWIPFIMGKILVAIGIYEILISFRKFKK